MSRQSPKSKIKRIRELRDKLLEIEDAAVWDEDIFRELFAGVRCIKCGSVSFEEIIDQDNGLVTCCTDCPEVHEHH